MTSVCGGGETGAVIALAGVTEKITHLSTGGGAMVEMLEGTPLPGLCVLSKRIEAKL
jgi:phosphoglycerate kinase